MIIIEKLEDTVGNLLNFGVHGTAVLFSNRVTDGISGQWVLPSV